MTKKLLLYITLGFIVLLMLISYFFITKRRIPDVNIYGIVPTDAGMIIESRSIHPFIHELRHSHDIWVELNNLDKIKEFNELIDTIGKLSKQNVTIDDAIEDRNAVISFHTLGNTVDFLFLMKLDHQNEKKMIKEYFTSILGEPVNKRNYNNTTIYEFGLGTKNESLSLSFVRGSLALSLNSILVENAIRQSDESIGISSDPDFIKVQKTAGQNVEGNVYINLKNFPELISELLSDLNVNIVSSSSNIGNWSELDINIKKDAILLNGFTQANDSSNNYLNLFKDQSPVDQETTHILPSNIAAFVSIGLSDPESFYHHYKMFLEQEGKFDHQFRKIIEYERLYGKNISQMLYSLMEDEIVLAINDDEQESEPVRYTVIEIESRSEAKEQFVQLLSEITQKEGWSSGSLKSYIQIDQQTSYDVYNLPLPGVLGATYGQLFEKASNKYLTFIDDFIVFAESKDHLRTFIHSFLLEKTLDNDQNYKQFSDFLSSRSNLFFYSNMFRSPYLVSDQLNPGLKKGLIDNINIFRKFQAFAYQFRSGGEMIYNNVFLKYIPEVKEEARTLWESHLDTLIDFKPVFVENHYTGENEIFVQDLSNNIYLINNVGRVLWKKKLEEPINSEIFQVDYYKNNKLQLLFSTKEQLHLIDRNGNYVERYPISFSAPSTTGLALFDYEKNKNYRIFIPCDDKKIYAFSIDGNTISGWEFNKTEELVKQPLEYYRIGTKDYIAFADENRIYILNRRGAERVSIKSQFSKAYGSKVVLESTNENTSPRLVTTDKTGIVKFIYFDGHVEEKILGTYTNEHYFDYQDVNADGLKDFIFLDENELHVYANDGDKLFFHKFEEEIIHSPVYYHFSYSDRKIGVTSRTTGEIYLFNSNGKVYPGFPLKGSTQFSIGFLENNHEYFNLIVGSSDNFLYNYAVN